MSTKKNTSDHKFPAPWRHHEPTEADEAEARRIIAMDGQLENPAKIYPYEFSEKERDSILDVLPDNAAEESKQAFLNHMAWAIGGYQFWMENPAERANYAKFYRELEKIRNYSDKLSASLSSLPIQFRERLDLGILMNLLRDPQFGQFPGKPRYWTADWSESFSRQLAAMHASADDVENHFKDKNKGGRSVDGRMTMLARETLAAYSTCFDEIPTKSKSHPFSKVLEVLAEIVGRYGAGVKSVFHYAGKVISEIETESSPPI